MKPDEKIPLVSVIIPVYNKEQYLENCYMGLKNQKHSNLEIIFVDDCSTDNSKSILSSFRKKDNRIKIASTGMNSGVSVARNVGLDICTGDFVGFCDADDRCEETMFQNMIEVLMKYNADISCCSMQRKKEELIIEKLWLAPYELEMDDKCAISNWLIGEYIGNSVCTKLCRTEIWDGIRFPVGEIFEESAVIPRLFLKAKKICHTGTVEYNYYIRSGSYTNSSFDDSKFAVLDRFEFLERFIQDHYPDLSKEFDYFKIRQLLSIMQSAQLNKDKIARKRYMYMKKYFQQLYFKIKKNPYISIVYRLRILEVYLGIFYYR